MPGLKLWLLGPPRIEYEDRPVDLQRRKVLALLAYLAVTGEAHRRDSLATLLWPDADQSAARTALRRDLSALNRALGRTWVQIDHESVSLKCETGSASGPETTLWLDLDEFHRLLGACGTHGHPAAAACEACLPLLEQAVGLYRGDFLAGFTLKDSPEFDEWQFFQAEGLRAEMASALERLVRGRSARGEEGPAAAIPFARRWLALDPLHEPAHRALMQLYTGTGQHSAALRQYAECSRILKQELGVPPAAETTALYETIKAGRNLPLPVAAGEQPQVRPAHPVEVRQAALAQLPSRPGAGEEPPAAIERPVFVAHEQELMQLDRALDRATAGTVQTVFVIGEAGSGKTALVQEFARRAQARDASLIVMGGNCNAYTGVGDPYLPFREILGAMTGDVEAAWGAGTTGGSAGRRLGLFVPQAIQALVRTGPDLVDTFVPGPALVARARLAAGGEAPWQTQLHELVARHASSGGSTSPQQTDLFEQYTRVIGELAAAQPLVLVLDDLQWADIGSINLLFHMGRRLRRSRVLIVGIYRPSELAFGRPAISQRTEDAGGVWEMDRHPLEPLVHEFQRQFGDILVDLSRAEGRQFVNALLDIEPNHLGPGFREALYEHTGGHALFTVEMLRGLQERGDLVRDEHGRRVEGPALNWEILPARVEGVIAERIGRLPLMLRELLKVASVEGEVFTAEVVARVQRLDERVAVRLLGGELDRQHALVRNQGSRRLSPAGQQLSHYRFRHILFQKYLYQSLDAAERAYLHEAVGERLEDLYGEQVEDIAGQLARHFEAAGQLAKAAGYLQQAGERAVRLSANEEALSHFNRELALLEALPPSVERDRQELILQIALFAPLAAVKGYATPEVGRAYARARELCVRLGDAPRLFQVLYGLWGHNLVRTELDMARELAQQCLALAQGAQEPALLLEANRMMGETAFHRGEVVPAQEYLEKSRALYNPEKHRAHAVLYGQDPGVALLAHGSLNLWTLGYADQALKWSREALALAQDVDHPFSTVFALEYASILHELRGDGGAALEEAEAAIALSTEQKFVMWLAMAEVLRASGQGGRGAGPEGIAQMRQSLAAYRATGAQLFTLYFLSLIARALGRAGEVNAALDTLEEALAAGARTGEHHWEAECRRLKGELFLYAPPRAGLQPDEGQAEALFLQAVATARAQGAKALELRSAMSLCRLWQMQGKRADARTLLAETYGWFTEGFTTADLQEARVLLEALG